MGDDVGIKIHACSLSDVGCKRSHNEDAVLCAEDSGLFCVADGMGGLEGGEEASQTVVKELSRLAVAGHKEVTGGAVEEAFRRAHATIREVGISKGWTDENGRVRIGTTATALLIHSDTKSAEVCHIGDSRLYRLRSGQLEQLSEEHSVEMEVRRRLKLTDEDSRFNFKMVKGSLSRAVGIQEALDLQHESFDVEPGDAFLLCSDGLTRYLSDDEIAETLRHGNAQYLRESVLEKLIDVAKERGGKDNISVVVATTGDLEAGDAADPSTQTPSTSVAATEDHGGTWATETGSSPSKSASPDIPHEPAPAPAQVPEETENQEEPGVAKKGNGRCHNRRWTRNASLVVLLIAGSLLAVVFGRAYVTHTHRQQAVKSQTAAFENAIEMSLGEIELQRQAIAFIEDEGSWAEKEIAPLIAERQNLFLGKYKNRVETHVHDRRWGHLAKLPKLPQDDDFQRYAPEDWQKVAVFSQRKGKMSQRWLKFRTALEKRKFARAIEAARSYCETLGDFATDDPVQTFLKEQEDIALCDEIDALEILLSDWPFSRLDSLKAQYEERFSELQNQVDSSSAASASSEEQAEDSQVQIPDSEDSRKVSTIATNEGQSEDSTGEIEGTLEDDPEAAEGSVTVASAAQTDEDADNTVIPNSDRNEGAPRPHTEDNANENQQDRQQQQQQEELKQRQEQERRDQLFAEFTELLRNDVVAAWQRIAGEFEDLEEAKRNEIKQDVRNRLEEMLRHLKKDSYSRFNEVDRVLSELGGNAALHDSIVQYQEELHDAFHGFLQTAIQKAWESGDWSKLAALWQTSSDQCRTLLSAPYERMLAEWVKFWNGVPDSEHVRKIVGRLHKTLEKQVDILRICEVEFSVVDLLSTGGPADICRTFRTQCLAAEKAQNRALHILKKNTELLPRSVLEKLAGKANGELARVKAHGTTFDTIFRQLREITESQQYEGEGIDRTQTPASLLKSVEAGEERLTKARFVLRQYRQKLHLLLDEYYEQRPVRMTPKSDAILLEFLGDFKGDVVLSVPEVRQQREKLQSALESTWVTSDP